MPHLVEQLQAEADAAIAAMRASALAARNLHARAELMRHMRMTTAKFRDRPRDEAVREVVDEWLGAWGLTRAGWPHVAAMEALTRAFDDYVRSPDDARDAALRRAVDQFAEACRRAGFPLEDQMAWRSMCAHDWWSHVSPPPADRRRADRVDPERPFWDLGCKPECL